MFRLRIYFLLLASLIVGGLLIGLFDPRGYTVVVPSYASGDPGLPRPQRASGRTWLEDGFTRVRRLGTERKGLRRGASSTPR